MIDDTIMGEYSKTSCAQKEIFLEELINSENIEEDESALISISKMSEPRTYDIAKRSPYWSNWENVSEDEMKYGKLYFDMKVVTFVVEIGCAK